MRDKNLDNQEQEKNSNFLNVNQRKVITLNIEELVNAGAHFGHPASKWNPKYKKYISSIKNGIHIINLEITIQKLEEVIKELSKIISSGGNISGIELNVPQSFTEVFIRHLVLK